MKCFVWMIIAVAMLYACNSNPEYTIMGELTDANGMKVMLKKVIIDSDHPVNIDSCVVKKGKFKMKGNVEYPEYCMLFVGDNGPLMLIVENTEIHIDFNLKKIQDSKVTGSKETDLFVEYNDKITRMDTTQQQRVAYMKQFVSEHPNSIVTALVINNNLIFYLDPEELETYADKFDLVNSKSPWVQSIKEKASFANSISIGQPFVDISLPAPDGNEIAFSDYADTGKFVLINFWASWSKLCRAANPQLVKLYHKYREKGFEIVGISLDKDKTEWIRAIKADSLTWPQMSDLMFWQSKAARLYSVNSIPYYILLDKDGKILHKGLQHDETGKPVELEKILEEQLIIDN